MKALLFLSAVLFVSVCIRAATVPPAGGAAVKEEKPAPNLEGEAETTDASAMSATPPQGRLNFCLNGWQSYRGNCFHLVNHPDTWTNAESYCAEFESSLASAHSIWEYRFLQRLAQTGGHSFAWLGGYFFQDDWRWEDGTLFDYNNWGALGSTYNHQCLHLNTQESQGWSNHACNMQFPFICQMRSTC